MELAGVDEELMLFVEEGTLDFGERLWFSEWSIELALRLVFMEVDMFLWEVDKWWVMTGVDDSS
jgi:hypothetical protein